MRARTRFFLAFCGALLIIALVIVAWIWNANGYFTQAYTPIVRQSQEAAERRQAENPPSQQPRPSGFSEKDIEKQRGDRYATY